MNIFQDIKQKRICEVISVNNPKECIKLANALYDGGIRIIEIILDPDFQPEVIENLKNKKDLAIIAGGIITEEQAIEALNAGAKILSSPVFQMN